MRVKFLIKNKPSRSKTKPVSIKLGIVHNPPDVHRLAGVGYPGANGNCKVAWKYKIYGEWTLEG